MKKPIVEAVPGEEVKVCGRLYLIIHNNTIGVYSRLTLFPLSGPIISPVQVIMHQDCKIRVYPSREIHGV